MQRHRVKSGKDRREGAINCRVRPKQLEYIREIADQRGDSMSSLTEQALVHFLKIDKKKWDAM